MPGGPRQNTLSSRAPLRNRLWRLADHRHLWLHIAHFVQLDTRNWTRAYPERGLTAWRDHRQGGNRARLTPEQIEAVQTQLHRFAPAQLLGAVRDNCVGDGQFWNVPDLARLLERDFGVIYDSLTSYRTLMQLMQKCGLSYQRPAKQYKSHSEVKVMDFEEQLEKKLMDIAQNAPDTVILAADEASLYLQASLMRVWAPVGQTPVGQTPVIRVAANRDSTHYYGALNLASGQETSLPGKRPRNQPAWQAAKKPVCART